MGIKTNSGFTIIEVMLFLAVTGALTVAILAGAGISIGQQRYRDSVNSLKSLVQTQYSEVTNVINSRDQDWTCDSAGDIAATNGSNGQPRGTSDCVMLGRFLTTNETGTAITVSNVVGYRTSGAATATSDLAELADNYTVTLSPIDQETTDVSWGARIVQPESTDPQQVSMLIVRSPLSGSVMTFTADGIQSDPQGMITAAAMEEPRHLCVDADDSAFVGRRLEVRIDAFATSQSAVFIPPESESVCG